jgi:hypothetical protein
MKVFQLSGVEGGGMVTIDRHSPKALQMMSERAQVKC